jgi:hypothetical protein
MCFTVTATYSQPYSSFRGARRWRPRCRPAAPTPDGLYGLSPEWSTLYGALLWNPLSKEKRVTLTIHEYCSISGVGIWFECLLMQLMLRDNPVVILRFAQGFGKRFDGPAACAAVLAAEESRIRCRQPWASWVV